ncbi:hypothetical protein BZ13_1585 [Francisella philomiragia subsp. philomiragia ATCC 25015]|uniref:ImmA/IrrE family metallo-endopeptidase n=1 Tax=Francisella TaxID=262 RepID=UPI0001AF7940|nr:MULTISPECIES: ImmA/IrrE family metallo-endopeptidase [Francisella]AJI74296.1 hypothetical protein BZ13_1585 [Francisella philomiragia subsp. philomiragia ATCC 25015]APA82413.1 Zn peptidase [Francisella tularensis subsp. novicida PA10-7858]APC96130.1 hypothetical protein KX02_350 [Francisella tularensis subsp. novicida]EET20231.1 predicted protein [Francisella philomiragia subsp. philomiragia ATCC 25015]MBK2237275.1 ImmA/IrrE family metallo-endopeptidase [Francisella philomiragia]
MTSFKVDYEKAEKKANSLLNSATTFPVDLKKICDDLQITIKDVSSIENPRYKKDDISGLCDKSNNIIYINTKDAPVRQLFTLAHELGHYMLHENSEPLPRHTAYNYDPLELEANHFAANLLMPTKVFKKVFEAFNGNINKISTFFGVSRPAVAFRADVIGDVNNEFS